MIHVVVEFEVECDECGISADMELVELADGLYSVSPALIEAGWSLEGLCPACQRKEEEGK